MAWDYAQHVLSRTAEVPVAPHVAARLFNSTGGNSPWLQYLGSTLSPNQLLGLIPLPFPLPKPRSLKGLFDVQVLSDAELRILLVASLLVSRRVDRLVDAAAVGADKFFDGLMPNLLRINDGYFELNESIRTLVLNNASKTDIKNAAVSLARSSRRFGSLGSAAWYSSHYRGLSRSETAALFRLANQQINHGSTELGRRIALVTLQEAQRHQVPRTIDAASEMVILTTFAGGYVSEAQILAERFATKQSKTKTSNLLTTFNRLAALSSDSTDPFKILHAEIKLLATLPLPVQDQQLFIALDQALEISRQQITSLDQSLASLLLTLVRSNPLNLGTPDEQSMQSPSPLTEAYVRSILLCFYALNREIDVAVEELEHLLPRLPMGIPGKNLFRTLLGTDAKGTSNRKSRLRAEVERLHTVAEPRRSTYESLAAQISRLEVTPPPRFQPIDQTLPLLNELTKRESEVFIRLVQGLNAEEIAKKMNISQRTVEVHLGRIYRKAQVHNRTQLLRKVHVENPIADHFGPDSAN